MKFRRAAWIAGALAIALAAAWLWTQESARDSIALSTAYDAAPSADPVGSARAIHTNVVAPRDAQPSTAELPPLPPEQRDTTLRTVRAPVVGCLTVAGLNTKNMDPRMHARLRVAPGQDGKPGIADFELLHGDGAPEVLRACLERALTKVALALPPDTEGYVLTPPLAGSEAGKQQSLQ